MAVAKAARRLFWLMKLIAADAEGYARWRVNDQRATVSLEGRPEGSCQDSSDDGRIKRDTNGARGHLTGSRSATRAARSGQVVVTC